MVAVAQVRVSGTINDKQNKEQVAFALLNVNAKNVFQSDIDGRFSFLTTDNNCVVEISMIGYEKRTISLNDLSKDTSITIYIQPKAGTLDEVVISPPYEKIRYIINSTIKHRNEHKPDLYPQYSCNIYYKMLGDIVLSDSIKSLSASDSFPLKNSHAFFSETYTKRRYKKPQKIQDEVLATKVSGWNKAPFAGLITDVLPFDIYSDFVSINGRNFKNVIAKGWQQNYQVHLSDEVLSNKDTLYILTFTSKNKSANDVFTKGTIYITSKNFAVTNFSATYRDPHLKQTTSVEQKYQLVNELWFPHQLNFEILWQKVFSGKGKDSTQNTGMLLKGNSYIDSVSFAIPSNAKFNKAQTTILATGADQMTDEEWEKYRMIEISEKEQNTYVVLDSIIEEAGIGNVLLKMDKLVYGYVPVSIFDIDLRRVYAFNAFEKSRLGIGIQTNEKLLKPISVGGWFGYGFNDRLWKYGAFAQWYMDKFKDKTLTVGYQQDLMDPGRLQIHADLKKDYMQMYLMRNVDLVNTYYLRGSMRLGYWHADIEAKQQTIVPQYHYALQQSNEFVAEFEDKHFSLGLRYAFGERRAPVMGRYLPSALPKYPVAYLKFNAGTISGGHAYKSDYMQMLAAVSWQKQINRLGIIQLLATGGISHSDQSLPLSKLFSGRGIANPSFPIYAFGSFITATPYQFYSDQYVSLFARYETTKALFSIKQFSKPRIALQHNYLLGSLRNAAEHLYFPINTAERGYHESGIMLQDLLRFNYLNMLYLNLNAGYFCPWNTNEISPILTDGRFVFSVSFNL